VLKPKALHAWCTRVLYNRRSKFDPLWNRLVIGGIEDGKPYETDHYLLAHLFLLVLNPFI